MPAEKQSAQARLVQNSPKPGNDAARDLALAVSNIRHSGPLDCVETRLAPMLASTNRRPTELTRLYQAGNALLYACQTAPSSLQRFTQACPLSNSCSQIIEPKYLNHEITPRSEPGTNPA